MGLARTSKAFERLSDPQAAANWCARARQAGRRIGFVPTMGALHEGHLELVRAAASACDAAVASVFVNPLQFDDPRDFERYPRDFEADARLLSGAGCSMAFTGTLAQFFPEAVDAQSGEVERARIDWRAPGPAALGLEGEHRKGHFEGVATIVARLFDVVGPDVAYFGEKDFQQTLVVRDLARARGGPSIVVVPTSREASGLARSSRNARLGPDGLRRAAGLWGALSALRESWHRGERRPQALERALRADLEARGLELEYAAVRDPERWTATRPRRELARAVALVAARVDGVRLIDNLRLDSAPRAVRAGAKR